MAEFFASTVDYRPCIIDGMEATFHRWADKSWIVPPSPVVGGHPGGEVRGVFAIVEMEDGSIREVEPEKVRFKTTSELFERRCMGKFNVPAVKIKHPLRLWEIKKIRNKWGIKNECTCPTCKEVLETMSEPPFRCPYCSAEMDGYYEAGRIEKFTLYPGRGVEEM